MTVKLANGAKETTMMTCKEFFAEAKRLNCRMVSDDPATVRAAFDAKDAEIKQLRAALALAEAALADIIADGLDTFLANETPNL